MIRSFTILFVVLVAVIFHSCTSENGIPLGKPSTFIRYFNGGNPDQAAAIIETQDKGFMILANTQVTINNVSTYKIKLIKTDAYGNQVSQHFFPSVSSGKSQRGYAITAIVDNSGSESGYVIAGENIDSNGNSNLLTISVDLKGDTSTSGAATKVYKLNKQVRGVGITKAKSTTGKYYLIGQILNPTTSNDMLLAELDKTTLDTLWTRVYGAGKSNLATRLFLNNSETSVYWGGTSTKDNPTTNQVSFTKSGFNYQNPLFDVTYGYDTAYLSGNDICQYGFNYAITGSRGKAKDQYRSVFYLVMNEAGIPMSYKEFAVPLVASKLSSAQTTISPANSICSTNDAGLLLLSTVAVDAAETDTDYYLIKIDLNGGLKWTKQHGSRFKDVGKQVIQASDGGYVILGTTTLANVPSIFLMKTDLDGEIQ
jgi:hypothetical protein